MKITRWGNGRFSKPQTVWTAVVVSVCIDGKIKRLIC